MANPAKIINFFDIFGTFDPSLALVVVGAVSVTSVGYRLVWRQPKPLLAPSFTLPTKTALDLRLISGAGLFGIGWGIAGFCPGGTIPALGLLRPEPFLFCAMMLAGMWIEVVADFNVPPRIITAAQARSCICGTADVLIGDPEKARQSTAMGMGLQWMRQNWFQSYRTEVRSQSKYEPCPKKEPSGA
eukprot:gene12650-12741_t